MSKLTIMAEYFMLIKLLNPESAKELISRERQDLRIGIRECSDKIGISPATLSRVERKGVMDTNTLKLIFEWLRK